LGPGDAVVPNSDPALPPPADVVPIDAADVLGQPVPGQLPESAMISHTSLDAPLPAQPPVPPPPPAPAVPNLQAASAALPNIPAPLYDIANQAATNGQLPVDPTQLPAQGTNLTYLQELLQAMQGQNLNLNDALAGLAQAQQALATP